MIGRTLRRIRAPKKITSQRHLVSCCHAGAGGGGGGGGAAKKCQCAGTGPWRILGDDYWQNAGLSSEVPIISRICHS